jgi:hypothetical protein
VTVDSSKGSPHGEINVVCALDVHGHTHRRRVRNERMRGVVGGNNDARADRLLSQMILQNLLLDALHDMTTEETNDRQVHACIHQPERIAGGDDTIKRRQILESATNNLNLWMRAELRAKDIAELLASIYENQSHGVILFGSLTLICLLFLQLLQHLQHAPNA